MVEFALVLPIFLLIVMATVDFGWALRGYISSTNAAREGARLGVTGASVSAIKERTVSRSGGTLKTSDVKVCTGTTCDGGLTSTDTSVVIVEATYQYKFLTPLGGLMKLVSGGTVPDPLPLSTSTTMRLE